MECLVHCCSQDHLAHILKYNKIESSSSSLWNQGVYVHYLYTSCSYRGPFWHYTPDYPSDQHCILLIDSILMNQTSFTIGKSMNYGKSLIDTTQCLSQSVDNINQTKKRLQTHIENQLKRGYPFQTSHEIIFSEIPLVYIKTILVHPKYKRSTQYLFLHTPIPIFGIFIYSCSDYSSLIKQMPTDRSRKLKQRFRERRIKGHDFFGNFRILGEQAIHRIFDSLPPDQNSNNIQKIRNSKSFVYKLNEAMNLNLITPNEHQLLNQIGLAGHIGCHEDAFQTWMNSEDPKDERFEKGLLAVDTLQYNIKFQDIDFDDFFHSINEKLEYFDQIYYLKWIVFILLVFLFCLLGYISYILYPI
jgi:hypothetical protein